MGKVWGKTTAFTRTKWAGRRLFIVRVDGNAPLFRRVVPSNSTCFAQALGIELLPNFSDLFADNEIKLYGFFNFFNGVDGGGVVFST